MLGKQRKRVKGGKKKRKEEGEKALHHYDYFQEESIIGAKIQKVTTSSFGA